MIKSSALRVAPSAGGVSIWSSEIFGNTEVSRVRDFLSRAFSVTEVDRVDLKRATSFGHIRYATVANPVQIWRKLSRALSSEEASVAGNSSGAARRIDAGLVYLDLPAATPVRVSRVGDSLSTWRVRHTSEGTLRLWHPLLRNRRDIVFRLEEELAAILGVEDFRASALTAGVSIRFDKRALTAEHLARELEKAWPRLLDGLDGPPSRKRLVAAAGLMGLSFTGQYLVPPLRPIAVAGMALYSAPNVINAGKQLARGEVGLPALYSAGLALMLVNRLPFAASTIAVLMQLWPQLARRTFIRSQRRLFAAQRRHQIWARVSKTDGTARELHVDDLRKGDLVAVQSGEIVPVDGVVEAGSASVVDSPAFGGERVADKTVGDAMAAGSFVRAGALTIRVERAGSQTDASYIASLLPRTPIAGLPSSFEAERIANRNAKPALALSALSLLVTRTVRPSQVLIRPDYATGPRLSAQLSALRAVAQGLNQGVLFRNAAALERLAFAQVYVIDDTAGLAGGSGKVLVAALKARHAEARIIYIARSKDAATQGLARTLGIELAGGLRPSAKVDFVRGLGRAVWVGDGSDPSARELIAASTVSISVASLAHVREDAADILLPQKGLSGLTDAIDVSRAHTQRLAQDYRTVYTANLLAVSGALSARFNGLHAGLVSNVGTGLIYARHARALNKLAAAAETERLRLKRSVLA